MRIFLIMLAGCGVVASKYQSEFNRAASRISIGMSKNKVLNILLPIKNKRAKIPSLGPETPRPEYVLAGSKKIEVHFFRTSRPNIFAKKYKYFGKERSLDTPYLFIDDVLTAIGWPAYDAAIIASQQIGRQSVQSAIKKNQNQKLHLRENKYHYQRVVQKFVEELDFLSQNSVI